MKYSNCSVYSFGKLGQSKTLSFQIVLQNLQGSQLSKKPFCKRLPAVDPFFCLGSKYTRSEDISIVFERAIKREQQYEQKKIFTRCVRSVPHKRSNKLARNCVNSKFLVDVRSVLI